MGQFQYIHYETFPVLQHSTSATEKNKYNLSCHKSEQICVKLNYVRNLCSPKQET
jgi:hypothetical protein